MIDLNKMRYWSGVASLGCGGVALLAAMGACSSNGSDDGLFANYSVNTPDIGAAGAGGVLTNRASGGQKSGGAASSSAMSTGGTVVQASGGTGGVSNTPSKGGSGGASSAGTGGRSASGGMQGTGGAEPGESGGAPVGSGGVGAAGALMGGGTGGSGGAVACQPGTERCDGRDENCTNGISDEQCPDGCIGISHGIHGYMFCAVNSSRPESNTTCIENALYLARVESAEENTWLRATATANDIGALWLGGRDNATEGVWRWTEGTQFWMGAAAGVAILGRYSNWQSGQPNNTNDNGGAQNCLRLGTDGRWDDIQCSEPLSGFVCRGD